MSLVEVDIGNPDLFKVMSFRTISAGKHLFEVENDVVVEPAKSSDNNVIKVTLVCQDEDENKGSKVWDNFTIVENPQTQKQLTSQKINQARLCQFAVACGITTQADIEAGGGVNLSLLKGSRCEAITKMEPYSDLNELDGDGKPVIKQRGKVVRYLFKPQKTSE